MDEGLLVPLGLFAMVVAIVWLTMHFGSKNRRAVLDTVQEAARSGQQLTPETIRALGMPRKTGGGDLKAGAIMLAIALSFVVLGWAIGSVEPGEADEVFPIMTAVASFPGFIGLVLLAFGWFNREKRRAE
ncbi:hypothetical protein E5163_13835 [Marinicauda algicola]|uniref:Uncharacterized protein n=1 Tax=Marinicauda algicola TaxID=2029849 RepID=A0A4S2GYL5_9PROT|nr:DUF6249 domain-containing protein [Marinicauda algicola]TGY87981.1 hypothetical protein E5163_13835 [Marinicauda algicola]